MKVAISLPDPLFSAAEQLAQKLRVSRSQLYAQALAAYLDKRHDAIVMERLNTVYSDSASNLDESLLASQLGAIGYEAW